MIDVKVYDEILGKIPLAIIVDTEKNTIDFLFKNYVLTFYHKQVGSESVTIEEVAGDMQDLIGKPLLMAEETKKYGIFNYTNSERNTAYYNWTFHKFATINGYVTVKWYSESNGGDFQEVSYDYRFKSNNTFPIEYSKRKGVTVYQ